MKRVKRCLVLAVSLSMLSGVFFAGCKKDDIAAEEITVYTPDGAPALALAGLMHTDTADDGVTYRVVDVSTAAGVKPLLSQLKNNDKEKNADLCVLPLTAAVQNFGTGDEYKMLGLVTQGNLYLVSKETTVYTKANAAALLGKTIYVKQMTQVPGQTIKVALTRNDVAWSLYEGGNKATDAVNLVSQADGNELELLAEPAVSKRLGQNVGWNVVGDLQELYGECGLGVNGYPQAVLLVKSDFLTEKPDWVQSFTQRVAAAETWLYEAEAADIYTAVASHVYENGQEIAFSTDTLNLETRRRCGVHFTYAAQAQAAVQGYLTETGNALPLANFYWEYQP
ncbi:MAG: hypothetical protein IJY63_03665 [Clostridia bacterium]|nr:hypothetical protein [Clostridia bacterium]